MCKKEILSEHGVNEMGLYIREQKGTIRCGKAVRGGISKVRLILSFLYLGKLIWEKKGVIMHADGHSFNNILKDFISSRSYILSLGPKI